MMSAIGFKIIPMTITVATVVLVAVAVGGGAGGGGRGGEEGTDEIVLLLLNLYDCYVHAHYKILS